MDMGDGTRASYINVFATPVSNDRIMVTGLVINEIYVASTQVVYLKQDGRVRMLEGSIIGLARATSKGPYGALAYGEEFEGVTVQRGVLVLKDAKPTPLPWLEKCGD